ncbi:MAG TPA: DeoR/GlpR family DNA-binding transcription regulator, partial [Sporolactobacillaceae bacterium]|nr:DeoR/GlpR family DNA-binding transcription regulator [Sporolactobacillaceae bacterium]
MFIEERQQTILKKLEESGRVTVKTLSDQLSVSIDTIRRDLMSLEKQGYVKRTHGGAIPGKKVRTMPQPPVVRYTNGTLDEQLIAKRAAAFISKGDTIFLSSAHLHYVMIQFLPRSFYFTVVTNSLAAADKLKDFDNIDTYVIGGKLRPSGSMTDVFAIEFLKGLKFDICYLVGGGISADFGVSTTTGEVAVFQRTAALHSRRVICMITPDRIGHEAFAQVVPIDVVGAVITNGDAATDEVENLREAGV